MKMKLTTFLITVMCATGLSVNAQNCLLTANVNAQPDSAGSLNYLITGTYSNGGNTLDYLTVGGTLYFNTDTVQYTFPSAGTYNVCYYVEDSSFVGYCYDSTCITVTAGAPGAPSTCSSAFNALNYGNGLYSFTASPTVPSGWAIIYTWNFGDGTSSGQNTPLHTYTNNGNYPVTLTILTYDPNDSTQNCTASNVDTIVVNNANGSTCSVQLSQLNTGGNTYLYDDNTTSNYASYQIWNSWTVDGVYAGSDTALTVNYTTTGNHNVCLDQWLIDNATGDTCITSDCILTTINTFVPCQASFVLWQDSLNPSVYYGYNNSTGNNLTYLWTFGDGTSSTLAYPSHTYSVTGTYNICLTVTDSATNCTSTMCDSAGVFKMMTGMSSVTILGTTTGLPDCNRTRQNYLSVLRQIR
jgi:PKD repeat protein